MLESVLVANRGEIARRIIATLRRTGVRSIAVYSDADRTSLHVIEADEAVRIGPAPAAESYLDAERILDAAARTGAAAVHPGYGFLSERASFALAVEQAGLAFIGPTPAQIELFGEKHRAREAAVAAGVPLLPGTGLLTDVDHAIEEAEALGFPVMLKSTGGGGGIGMHACLDVDSLAESFEQVRRLGEASFGSSGVFLERLVTRARHVEVQVFGDGAGRVVDLGVRDCSLQRRNQKVVEETPPPGFDDATMDDLAARAVALAASVGYRSAGTVEFVHDTDREETSFLEVNTRLQVEHPITEAVFDIDLVDWMVRLAGGDATMLDEPRPRSGHAIEVRVYAEDASRGHRPDAGVLTEVSFPTGGGPDVLAGGRPDRRPDVRVDTWIETGTEVTPHYDPLLAKVITHGADRATAVDRMVAALDGTRLAGIETNVEFVAALLRTAPLTEGTYDTGTLGRFALPLRGIEVERPGHLTTVQDLPGRLGYWHVGVPPSGPMDDRSFALGNQALGNAVGAAGLELTLDGPCLRFHQAALICLTGAPLPATVDGHPVSFWEPVEVPAGAVVDLGSAPGPGLRTYLLVQGGIDVPEYLGSRSTFTLGGFGGHGGRALRPGDVLRIAAPDDDHLEDGQLDQAQVDRAQLDRAQAVPVESRPALTGSWRIGVLEGPHGTPEFFTPEDIDTFYATEWQVHHNSSRTGVRLIGPKPTWARPDGGEAGLHPSNIHDTAYAVGTVDFTGDMPILLGPDGPSLGGFVCPATVVEGERWKLGQLRPGDTLRFVPVAASTAEDLRTATRHAIELLPHRDPDGGVLARLEGGDGRPQVCYRRSGDSYLLVEYGPMILDLGLRLRVHALAEWIEGNSRKGIIDLTPGIRSLQVHVDPDALPIGRLLSMLIAAEADLPVTDELEVPSREVHLPLSWDDPATREAIERYMAGVRPDAPWCPWNIEFIRRINGLDAVEDVRRIVYDASYLVLGLGDVYLGAPVATPVDPRHRLVTTKYNPARTWTPENAVGIGGAYLCIYGMEGPGGYQFVGRTVPVWNTYRTTRQFEPGHPWLLRFFDRIRWYPVEAEELLDLRADLRAGRFEVPISEGSFRLADHERALASEAADIASFRSRQQAAFAAERAAWEAAGEFDERPEPEPSAPAATVDVPPGGSVVHAALTASVWRIDVEPGQLVAEGDVLIALEAMKTEVAVTAPSAGVIQQVLTRVGQQVDRGAPLMVLAPLPSAAAGGRP